jgi:hypothetical protein
VTRRVFKHKERDGDVKRVDGTDLRCGPLVGLFGIGLG